MCGKVSWFQPVKSRTRGVPKKGTKKDPGKVEAQVEGTYYLPHTPYSQVKKKVQKVEGTFLIEKTGRIRVLERLGLTIAKLISNPTPWG